MRIRNNLLRVWLSDKEYSHLMLQVEKSGMKRSQFIRSIIMKTEVRARPPDEYFKLVREVNAIGNNINQIAHIANANGNISKEKIDYVIEYLDKIMEKVRDVY